MVLILDVSGESTFWIRDLKTHSVYRQRMHCVKLRIIIITCFIRCWQNAAKYNHEVGLIYIKVDKTIYTNEIKCNLDEGCNAFTNC